ncbi:putative Short-chain dehydrogenase/reductase SDR [Nitrospina gracilis 3/211]|uniref:Putative Short-chain dehydrogenase/reductase SDR n=1 Tax=Nitrospina gracilis (strain 3/211) TaxID=1266370 RepID=M1YZ78_NITG3|nr:MULTISPECIES: SDR family oxidoreductase [Nitrospina]MCF8723701.1 NAD(P)-dependent dehydrogenase (short-subunit alcohol dehydrogenase family) [Nitrospina sp. Nb-3]CCQ90789.1 putative Short-chain dehydrogenase/reductase SDR [Nitrospina gracilis 3/211]
MPTAIVTGAAVRIGKALACRLADRGYDLAVHHYHSQPDDVLAYAKSKGVKAKGYSVDLTDLAAAEKLIPDVLDDFPDVEVLINSAANFIQQNIEATTNETLTDTLHLNLMTPYLLMREYKRRVNRGLIVNILDERINKNIPTFAAYSVAKVALAHATHLAAVEWGDTVRVNGIAPGLILPPPGHGDEYLTRNAPYVPTKTHGQVEDIMHGLDYLLTSRFVNGEVLFIDGGESKARRSPQ